MGEARLAGVEPLALDGLDPELKRFKVRQAARGRYEGRQPLHVELYEMANPKTAFTMVRLARAGAPFYSGDYYGIVEAPGAEAGALDRYRREFISEFEKKR